MNSDTPRTDAALEWVRPVDQTDTAPPNEQYVDAEFARDLERENAALQADKNRLLEAAELGLEYAEEALAQEKISMAGYPHRWAQEEIDVAQITAAIDAAKGGSATAGAYSYYCDNPDCPVHFLERRKPSPDAQSCGTGGSPLPPADG